MTPEEIQASRDAIGRLKGYSKGIRPQLADSFPRFVENELGLKVAPTIQNLIAIIKTLDARIAELEGPQP